MERNFPQTQHHNAFDNRRGVVDFSYKIMYCDKENVNLLTARLIETGIKDIVVSPGSRNAVLIHNFHEASKIDNSFRLHPVTDERSAAFFAIGIWIVTHKPVAVCVTSGSALLNTLPAVAEAFYRQIPLVVIDRKSVV